MQIYNKITSLDGELIADNLPYTDCSLCIMKTSVAGYKSQICPKTHVVCRSSYLKNSAGICMACSQDAKTTKLFKTEVALMCSCSTNVINSVLEIRKQATQQALQRTQRLLRNLKTLNAHVLQDLYTLIPQQELLRTNMRQHLDKVEPIIKSKTRQTALTIFDIAKTNMGMKAEFSIFEKLSQGEPQLNVKRHNVRDVVMIVLHMFFNDFNDQQVYVDVDDYYDKVPVDFESFHVAVYHVVENAAKYVAPKSTIHISFPSTQTMQSINFEMTSLYIQPGEEDLIFAEGYSGITAKASGKSGHGIGMYRAKRLIQLNNGEITVEAGDKIERIYGLDFAKNLISISIPI